MSRFLCSFNVGNFPWVDSSLRLYLIRFESINPDTRLAHRQSCRFFSLRRVAVGVGIVLESVSSSLSATPNSIQFQASPHHITSPHRQRRDPSKGEEEPRSDRGGEVSTGVSEKPINQTCTERDFLTIEFDPNHLSHSCPAHLAFRLQLAHC